MTHDEFCNQAAGRWDGGCQCAVIAKVRKSEREKMLTEVSIMNCRVHDYEDGMCHVAIDDLIKMLETL